ncbi:MAG: bifunctional phosphopantothenoylcysteine decarboxylase/phosphopantothenate synthase [Gemmataceae bacterium]|nr:bifunctional phosphopantothenoylcysteine decarboxylase/phosphopantothenate synthase [Gemmataceae bacterium]
MNILVTAGNTLAMIDRVRCLTNVFSGRTGAALAHAAAERGHRVTLLTSAPETSAVDAPSPWRRLGQTVSYRTFDELASCLGEQLTTQRHDAVIHAAAVADYLPAGVYAPAPGTIFDPKGLVWHAAGDGTARLVDCAAAKVKSSEPELWLRLTRAPKLVDRIRSDWGFRGLLVKFKLEVGLDERQLLTRAEHSRRVSRADWMVANTLETVEQWAWVGPFADGYHKVARRDLPNALLDALEMNRTASE